MKKQCTIDAILQFHTMEMWKTTALPMENRYSRPDRKAASFPTARKYSSSPLAGQHHGEQALGFQRQVHVAQVVVGHHRVIVGFLNAEYRHTELLLSSVLKSVLSVVLRP